MRAIIIYSFENGFHVRWALNFEVFETFLRLLSLLLHESFDVSFYVWQNIAILRN